MSLPVLLEDAFREASVVEYGNDRDEGDVEKELYHQRGL